MDRLVNASTSALDSSPDGADGDHNGDLSPGALHRPAWFHTAEGGLGQVFTAQGDDVSRRVALKFIRPRRVAETESRRRFLFEGEG